MAAGLDGWDAVPVVPPRTAAVLPAADCLIYCPAAVPLTLLDRTGLILAEDAVAAVRLLCATVPLPDLFDVPVPPRVDTLLVKTLSEPVRLRRPCHLLPLPPSGPPGKCGPQPPYQPQQ